MSRLFWMGVGATLAVVTMVKGRQVLHKITPAGMAEQIETRTRSTAHNVGEFLGAVRTLSAEREAELREEILDGQTAARRGADSV